MNTVTRERSRNRVLVLGIYLADRPHAAPAISMELNRARHWAVEQKWIALGSTDIPHALRDITIRAQSRLQEKFTILNQLVSSVSIDDYAYLIVCDDDIELPAGFLDEYLDRVRRYGFALAQPARTHDSYIDHPFVERLDGIDARWTRFVEIGPLISIRPDALKLMVPFDERSPMGWGFDLVWPCVLEASGFKLGIVDATPVAHRMRRPVANYDHSSARETMERYLDGRDHLSIETASVIIESYD